jgi:hypothetical protein
MIALLIIATIAITLALIRAKHDSFISAGPWKAYAFIEGVAIDLMVTMGIVVLFQMQWWMGSIIAPLYGFIFWLTFDMACGWIRHGDITYLGTTGWDAEMRKVFRYPDWRWAHIIFRAAWIVILTGAFGEFV